MSAPFTPEQEKRIVEIAVSVFQAIERQRISSAAVRRADDLATDAEWALQAMREGRDG